MTTNDSCKQQKKKNNDIIVETNLTPENIKQFETRLANELFIFSITQEDNKPISES
jgi:hypothetical protein